MSSLRPTSIGLQILQAISHDFEEEVAVLSEPNSSADESARSSKFHCIPIESSPLSMHDSDTLLAALRDVVSVCGSVPKSFSGCLPGGPNTLWNPPLPETGWIGASTHPVTRIRIDLALKGMETK